MRRAAVVGAGVFGASIARELRGRGFEVQVYEQYTPGNVRSGSGGDTRLLRFAHGEEEWYTRSALRALELWRELEAETGLTLFEPVGVAWFDTGASPFTAQSEATLARLGIPTERLSPSEARRLYPSLGGRRPAVGAARAGRGRALRAGRDPRARARPDGRARPADAGRAAARRHRRLGLRLVAAEALPGPRRAAHRRAATSSSSASTAPGRARPASASSTAPSTATASSAGSG